MSIPVQVPPMGELVTEAIVVRCNVRDGDFVELDAELVELETDKVNIVISAPVFGILKGIKVKEGDTVGVGDVIAFIEPSDAAAKGR